MVIGAARQVEASAVIAGDIGRRDRTQGAVVIEPDLCIRAAFSDKGYRVGGVLLILILYAADGFDRTQGQLGSILGNDRADQIAVTRVYISGYGLADIIDVSLLCTIYREIQRKRPVDIGILRAVNIAVPDLCCLSVDNNVLNIIIPAHAVADLEVQIVDLLAADGGKQALQLVSFSGRCGLRAGQLTGGDRGLLRACGQFCGDKRGLV